MNDTTHAPVLTFDPTGSVTFAPSGRAFAVNCDFDADGEGRTFLDLPPQGECAGAPYWASAIAVRHPLDARAKLIIGFGIVFANRFGMTLFFYDAVLIADAAARLEIYRMQQERGGTIQVVAARGMIGFSPAWSEPAQVLAPVPATETTAIETLIGILAAVPEPIGPSQDEAWALLKAGIEAGARESGMSARFIGGAYGEAA